VVDGARALVVPVVVPGDVQHRPHRISDRLQQARFASVDGSVSVCSS
jgi:hypothetical protein